MEYDNYNIFIALGTVLTVRNIYFLITVLFVMEINFVLCISLFPRYLSTFLALLCR